MVFAKEDMGRLNLKHMYCILREGHAHMSRKRNARGGGVKAKYSWKWTSFWNIKWKQRDELRKEDTVRSEWDSSPFMLLVIIFQGLKY